MAHQLAAWGDAPEPAEQARRRAARPVERDLEAVLADLADDSPLLAALVEQRTGGQRRLSAAAPSAAVASLVFAAPGAPAERAEAAARVTPAPSATRAEPSDDAVGAPVPPGTGHVAGSGGRERRPARYGLGIQFEARPDDPELAQLVESTVWVNESHPAYRRAVASRSEGYHVALAVAMALAPLAVDPAKEHGFINAFLATWGAALERRKDRRRRG